MLFSAELTMPVPGFGKDRSMRFGPFFDAGQVYGEEKTFSGTCVAGKVCDQGPIRMSVGLAAIWISPLGPLKFSLAQPLNKQENDTLQRFQFQMGQTF